MVRTPKPKTLPPEIQEQLNRLASNLRHNDNALLIWKQCLTEKERKQIERRKSLGSDVISWWCHVKKVSRARAVLEMSSQLGWLPGIKYEFLLQAIGEGKGRAKQPTSAKPNYKDGVLICRGDVLRKVKRFQKKSSLEVLLEAFQSQGWRRSITNPWLGKENQENVYHAVNKLNKGLEAILFEVFDSGNNVRWRLKD